MAINSVYLCCLICLIKHKFHILALCKITVLSKTDVGRIIKCEYVRTRQNFLTQHVIISCSHLGNFISIQKTRINSFIQKLTPKSVEGVGLATTYLMWRIEHGKEFSQNCGGSSLPASMGNRVASLFAQGLNLRVRYLVVHEISGGKLLLSHLLLYMMHSLRP